MTEFILVLGCFSLIGVKNHRFRMEETTKPGEVHSLFSLEKLSNYCRILWFCPTRLRGIVRLGQMSLAGDQVANMLF